MSEKSLLGAMFHWDGVSPIAGEHVTRVLGLSGHQFIFTATAMYEVYRRGDEPFQMLQRSTKAKNG